MARSELEFDGIVKWLQSVPPSDSSSSTDARLQSHFFRDLFPPWLRLHEGLVTFLAHDMASTVEVTGPARSDSPLRKQRANNSKWIASLGRGFGNERHSSARSSVVSFGTKQRHQLTRLHVKSGDDSPRASRSTHNPSTPSQSDSVMTDPPWTDVLYRPPLEPVPSKSSQVLEIAPVKKSLFRRAWRRLRKRDGDGRPEDRGLNRAPLLPSDSSTESLTDDLSKRPISHSVGRRPEFVRYWPESNPRAPPNSSSGQALGDELETTRTGWRGFVRPANPFTDEPWPEDAPQVP